MTSPRLLRILAAHRRTAAAIVAGIAAYAALLPLFPEPTRSIAAWDVFGAVFLTLVTTLMLGAQPADMPANARAQEEGEWSIFILILLGVIFSFAVVVGEFAGAKDLPVPVRRLHFALVAGTLILTWLVTHAVFALRYAHEYYTLGVGPGIDKGLDFPSDDEPDYWDFVYFSVVLGMTFQVSDVQITSRKLRRLATVHGLIGFLFNTVILALTVNIAASLMG